MTTLHYVFREDVAFEDVEAALLLARVGLESLHGHAAHLEAGHLIDRSQRHCILAGEGGSAEVFNALFSGLLEKGVGYTAFQVHRCQQPLPVR